jgi:hypothetical protein
MPRHNTPPRRLIGTVRWAAHTLWLCASDVRIYPQLARAARRDVVYYALVVLVVISVPLTIAVGRLFTQRMQELVTWSLALPTFTIIDGRAQFAAELPVRLERYGVGGVGDVVIALDPTGTADLIDATVDVGVVIQPEQIIIRQQGQQRTYPLRDIDALTIDDAFMLQWSKRLTSWFYLLLPLLLLVYHVVGKTLQALCVTGIAYLTRWWPRMMTWQLYIGLLIGLTCYGLVLKQGLLHSIFAGLLALLMLQVVGSRLAYGQLLRLAVFAMGPPTVFAAIIESITLERAQPILWFVYVLLYGTLLGGAIRSTSRVVTIEATDEE